MKKHGHRQNGIKLVTDPSTYRFVCCRHAGVGCTVCALTVVGRAEVGSVLHGLDGIIGAAASAASDAGPTNSFPSAAAGGGSESAGVEADAGGSVSSCSRNPTVELPACTFNPKSV